MTTPDILTAKINHGFDHLDAHGDGQLTEHDHVLMGQRVAASLGHAPGSPAEQQIIEAYLGIWRGLHLPHIPGGTAISKEQFLESTRTLASDPAAAQATVGAVATAFLAIADTDHDGQISPAEFRVFHGGHFPDLTEAEANEAFAHLDTDGDGYLSAEELTQDVDAPRGRSRVGESRCHTGYTGHFSLIDTYSRLSHRRVLVQQRPRRPR